jgi:hypothetical protein
LAKLFLKAGWNQRQFVPEQCILREDKIRRGSVFPECASELFAQALDQTRAATRMIREISKFLPGKFWNTLQGNESNFLIVAG